MIVLRKFIIFLMFSAFLVGCTTPLIDIDVKHSTGGGPGSGGSGCAPWAIQWGCISGGGASLPLAGTVTEDVITFTDPGADTIKVYTVTVDGNELTLHVPPWIVVEPAADKIKKNDVVSITYINRTIEKTP